MLSPTSRRGAERVADRAREPRGFAEVALDLVLAVVEGARAESTQVYGVGIDCRVQSLLLDLDECAAHIGAEPFWVKGCSSLGLWRCAALVRCSAIAWCRGPSRARGLRA